MQQPAPDSILSSSVPQRNRKTIVYFCILLAISIAIRIFAFDRELVESFYSTGIYPYIASGLRVLSGWLPFSLGDLVYLLVILTIIYKIVKHRRRITQYKLYITGLQKKGFRWMNICLLVYIVFNVLWGLNYNRKGIQHQLRFAREPYSKEALALMNELLLQKVNAYREQVTHQNIMFPEGDSLFNKAIAAYQQASTKYQFLQYRPASIKKSLYSWLGNHMGISGYYNPFSGEAQVISNIPVFLQPFVSCHEIAHQLGYAKENEANFVGYLVATGYGDPAFKYSAYLDLFLYANRNLYTADSTNAKSIRKQLHPLVEKDIDSMRAFYLKYQNPVEPYIRWVYGKYLQANDQPSGMMSYNEVVADLIGYYKKYGRIGEDL